MSRTRVIRQANHQTGRTSVSRDKARRAMKPGMRVSRNGNRYYEGRKNRSDLKRRI